MARPPLPTPPAESSPIATASSAPSAAPVGLAAHAAVEQVRRLITKDCAPLEFFDKLLALLTADHPAAIGDLDGGNEAAERNGSPDPSAVPRNRRHERPPDLRLLPAPPDRRLAGRRPLTRRHTLGVTIPFPFTALVPIRDAGKRSGSSSSSPTKRSTSKNRRSSPPSRSSSTSSSGSSAAPARAGDVSDQARSSRSSKRSSGGSTARSDPAETMLTAAA